MLKHSLNVLLVTFSFVACTTERPPSSPAVCLDYALDIQPTLDRACGECHGTEPVDANAEFVFQPDGSTTHIDGELNL
jgi:hypothetical protein